MGALLQWELHFKLAKQVPEGLDPNEWLALHSKILFFKQFPKKRKFQRYFEKFFSNPDNIYSGLVLAKKPFFPNLP